MMINEQPTPEMWKASAVANDVVREDVEQIRERIAIILDQDAKGYFTVAEFAGVLEMYAADLTATAQIWQNIYSEALDNG